MSATLPIGDWPPTGPAPFASIAWKGPVCPFCHECYLGYHDCKPTGCTRCRHVSDADLARSARFIENPDFVMPTDDADE